MGRMLARLAVAVLFASFVSGCATSVSNVGTIPAASLPVSSGGSAIPDSAVAAAVPAGFISFCVRFADQCQAPQDAPATITLTDEAWQTLKQVNAAVNASIWAEDDQAHYGRAEYWTIPTDGYGDCEDYALAKRKQLIGVGFPEPALRIAIVITPREARHAVLTVATDKGDYVLDNLSNAVVAWNATGYSWIERQDPRRPMTWVSLQPPTMVAANASLPVGGTQPASSIK
jgi:predicted transglutaminase-like cysteine proteinase